MRRSVRQSLTLVRAAAPNELKAVVALQVVAACCLVAQLFLLRRVLDVVIDGAGLGGAGRLWPALAGLAAATAVGSLATGLAGERQRFMVELVRRHAMERILAVTTAVELSAFETGEFNDALSRARQHALVRPPQVVGGILGIGQSLIASAALLVALVAIAPVMLPFLLVGVVPAAVLLRRNSRDLHDVDRKLATVDRECWYLENVLSTPGGAKETRTFRLSSLLGPMHRALANRRVDDYRTLIRRRSYRVGTASVLGAVVVVAGLGTLGALVLRGRLSPADAAAAAVIVQQLTSTLRAGGAGAGAVYENGLFLQEVDDFLAMAPPTLVPTEELPARPGLKVLRVDHLHFTYPGTDRPVLRDVSLEIAGGQAVAVVGENGSGKTTLTKLLCGLYPTTSGSIHWDDEDVKDVDQGEWRSRFGVVFQDFMRYELSAQLNVAVGRHEARGDLDRVRAAARLADADGFLTGLPEGYGTVLSRAYAGGADLSLGQWQRLALARAFFSEAPVLVLDEPTAALDPRVEQELLQRVRSFAGQRTVVLISHRLSSVRFVDTIFVLRDGVLVEQGGHDELVRQGGHYAELFEMQAAAYRIP
ncbi:MAG: ATP-binding cassette, subfamily bacterial [Actinomycetota bacterium]|nr:ATP-binding cassette, subfamily bacterial [Actinomycetota bacterium]